MVETIGQIEDLAYEARTAFEQRTIPESLLGDLYLKYHPRFLDIDTFIKFSARIFPAGNCALATTYLQHIYGEGEIIDGYYGVKEHTFLGIGKLAIAVDITADQFDGPAVYVGPIELPWSR